MRKSLFAILGAAAIMGLAIPAAAETFTSSDGIISIELPSDNWAEIQDPEKWVALSDGSNLITMEHFSNGEKLPEIQVADDHYANTLTASFSTKNEVFIITGYVSTPEIIQDINESLLSVKILKYDTKLAVVKGVSASEFTVIPRDQTMYVNVGADGLNVRNGCSVSSPIIGTLQNGTAVRVTGVVQRNGADYGWYQIAFGSGTGYVAAEYLSDTAPAAPAAPAAEQSSQAAVPAGSDTQEVYLVYSQGSGRPVNITGSNGVFYDGFGDVYYAVGGGNFVDTAGAYYSTTVPASAPETDVVGLVSDGSGRPVSVLENPDGSYTDEEGVNYYYQGNGVYEDEYGATYQVSGGNNW